MEILKPSPKTLNKADSILKNGGVVIYPTDTVFGFLADATNKKAVDKIYKIKKRLKSKPLPVFVKDLKMAKELTETNEKQERILRKYWPGKYTFILKRNVSKVRPRLSEVGPWPVYGVNKKTIAIRIPKYKFLNDLLLKINRPLVQTSVNISSKKPINNISNILTTFGKNKLVGLIINGGRAKVVKPSKIFDLTSKHLTKLR